MTYCYSVRKMGTMFCDCYFAIGLYNSCPREGRAMKEEGEVPYLQVYRIFCKFI